MHLRTERGALAEDFQYPVNPLYTNKKPHIRKARSYKLKSLEWNNAAIEVKKEKTEERKILPFHTPTTGPH